MKNLKIKLKKNISEEPIRSYLSEDFTFYMIPRLNIIVIRLLLNGWNFQPKCKSKTIFLYLINKLYLIKFIIKLAFLL